MRDYLAFLGGRAREGILADGLGDWYDWSPEKGNRAGLTPPELTATAFYFQDAALLSRTDQRMALIRLTPAGLDLTRAFEPVAHARQKRLLAGLLQREAFRVIDMLQKNADQLLKEP